MDSDSLLTKMNDNMKELFLLISIIGFCILVTVNFTSTKQRDAEYYKQGQKDAYNEAVKHGVASWQINEDNEQVIQWHSK